MEGRGVENGREVVFLNLGFLRAMSSVEFQKPITVNLTALQPPKSVSVRQYFPSRFGSCLRLCLVAFYGIFLSDFSRLLRIVSTSMFIAVLGRIFSLTGSAHFAGNPKTGSRSDKNV